MDTVGKVIGFEERKGVFEGNDYHNIMVYGTNPLDDGKGVGIKAEIYKVKYPVISKCFDRPPTLNDLNAYIGREATFLFDRYKNVARVEFSEPATPPPKPPKAPLPSPKSTR